MLGAWTGAELVCERQVCPALSLRLADDYKGNEVQLTAAEAGEGTHACVDMAEGDECVLQCPTGWERTRGSPRRLCLAGQWAGKALVCTRLVCRDLLPPPNTVEEASRRRSKPQDEMQRILAYNAQVLCWAYLCLVFPSESSQSL